MTTWNEIITEPGLPNERLQDLFGLWTDIAVIYSNPPIITYDPITYTANINPEYNRILYPSKTTSIIKLEEDKSKSETKEYGTKYISQDQINYRLIKALATIFNNSLDSSLREVLVRKYLLQQSTRQIRNDCALSAREYYRRLNKASRKLIMEYCLDHYDQYGIEKKNWFVLQEERHNEQTSVCKEERRKV